VTMTDVCSTGGADATPAADSAWIDPAVEPGVVDLGGGYVRETVAVGVGKVTVTSDDPGLRAQVLASARPAGVDSHGCPASLRGAPTGTTDSLEPESLSVCLYQTHRGETTLVWAARQPREAARELLALVHETSAVFDPGRICPEPADGQWVGLGLTDEAGVRAWLVATMGECSQILWPGGGSEPVASPLTRETVGPWALPGIRAYAWGPQDQADWSGVFRGYLG
jgi:hypothetical protein